MNATTLKALKASIRKWERNARAKTPEEYKTKGSDCALCVLFPMSSCGSCPVANKTGYSDCVGTPYYDARAAAMDWAIFRTEQERNAAHAAAREEVAFLKSLLPKGKK